MRWIAPDADNQLIWTAQDQITAIDVSDPSNPSQFLQTQPFGESLRGVWVSDGHLFYADKSHIHSTDISDRDNIRHADSIQVSGNAYRVDRAQDQLIAVDSLEVNLIDISVGSQLHLYNDFYANGVTASTRDENILILGKGTQGITVYDITDPDKPKRIDNFGLPGFSADYVTIDNDKLLIVDGARGTSLLDLQGLKAVTVPDILNLTPIASYRNDFKVMDSAHDGNDTWLAHPNAVIKLDTQKLLAGAAQTDVFQGVYNLPVQEPIRGIAVGGGKLGVITDNTLSFHDVTQPGHSVSQYTAPELAEFRSDNNILPFNFQDIQIKKIDGKPNAFIATDFAVFQLDISEEPKLVAVDPTWVSYPSALLDHYRGGLLATTALASIFVSPIPIGLTIGIPTIPLGIGIPITIASIFGPIFGTPILLTTAAFFGADFLMRDVVGFDPNKEKQHSTIHENYSYTGGFMGIDYRRLDSEGVVKQTSILPSLLTSLDFFKSPSFMDDLIIMPGIDSLFIGTFNPENEPSELNQENYLRFNQDGITHEREAKNDIIANLLRGVANPSRMPLFIESVAVHNDLCLVALGQIRGGSDGSSTVKTDKVAVLQRANDTLELAGYIGHRGDGVKVYDHYLEVIDQDEGLKVFDLEDDQFLMQLDAHAVDLAHLPN